MEGLRPRVRPEVGAVPDDVHNLSERIAGRDVEGLAGRGAREAARTLGEEADVYLCVGLEMSNAFMVVVEGEPAVGVASKPTAGPSASRTWASRTSCT